MSVLASPHRARAAGAHPALMVWGAALGLLIAAVYATPLLKPVLSWAYDSPRGWIVPLLGLTPHGSYRSERENVDEDIALCGDVEVDLMQPIDPDAKPRVHEPALNHVGLWVDDLRAAVSWLVAGWPWAAVASALLLGSGTWIWTRPE